MALDRSAARCSMEELVVKHAAIMDKYDPKKARRSDRGRVGRVA